MNDPQPEGHMASYIGRTKILSHASRRRGVVAARGARAAAGLTRFEDEISMVSATTVGPVRYTSASRRSGRGASRAVSSNSSSAKRYGLTLSWESVTSDHYDFVIVGAGS